MTLSNTLKLATAVALVSGLAACDNGPPPALQVSSVAAPKNISTGGDALIEVTLPADASASRVSLSVNGTETKTEVKAGATGDHVLVAKVTGLINGSNKITALYRGKEAGRDWQVSA